jgi:outer membrane protein insertion porin family
MKKIAYLIIALQLLISSAFAQQAFVVQKIDIQGSQRITPATVESYLPIKRGQTLRPADTAAVVRALYQTGFFDHISLSREGNTLVIHVVERPTIGQLKITGNSVVPTDKLTTVMKSLDIAEGRVYNPAMLEKIKQSLLNQYYQLGRYNARVNVYVTPMSRNRVMVKIDISEGLVAKIKRISIIGNHVFDESTLIKQMDISTAGLFTFISQTDRYSEERLEASLDKLRNYYMDHGYLRFEVKSSQAEVTPDRKSVYITIVISEGEPYTVERYEVEGKTIVPREEIIKRIQIKPGETFSRKKVIDSEKAITDYLGNQGYIFTKIALYPQVNDKQHKVILVFKVNPGKRAYVRQVTFSDNTRTNDTVLRREIMQMEAAPASTSKIEESKRNLLMLPYIKEADVAVKPVANRDDQIDVNYRVKEENSAQASFKLGYSQLNGPIVGAGFNQKNFFGTGNTLGINFQRSKVEQSYGVDYTNPYYTPDGISRSFNFLVARTDPGETSRVSNSYTTNQYNLGVTYGIPIGQEEGVFSRIYAGATYENILLNTIIGKESNQVKSFIKRHGRHFQEADLKLGYSRNSLDRAIFPTQGIFQSLFLDGYLPLDSNSLSYYTVNYVAKWYQPLGNQFIFLANTNLGYGDGWQGARNYPFFKNFFAGGIGTVRGYQGYTLGPRDSNSMSYGGNMLANATVNLIFPNYLSDNVRTSAFVDAGNVYSSLNNRGFGGGSTNSGPIRYSAGIDMVWLTPFGAPIELSLAQPINKRPNDDREIFQFSLGANF